MRMRVLVILRVTFRPQRGLIVVAKGVNEYCDEDGGQYHNKDKNKDHNKDQDH